MAADPKERFDAVGREKVQCKECGLFYHRLDVHISRKHGINVDEYLKKYPGSLTISEAASEAASKSAKGSAGKPIPSGKPVTMDKPKGIADTNAAKELIEKAAPKEGTYRIGVATLQLRKGLDENTQALVPAFDEHFIVGSKEKERWEYLALGLESSDNILITGPTGCGKSLAVQQLASICGQPLRRINLHGEVRASDFVGDKTVEVDPETNQAVVVWKDGILPDAMRNGHWLLLDELDAAPAHVLFVLQAVLEAGHRLVLSANNGEVIHAHPEFRIIATANTVGRGDETGLYSGTNILNEAFLDRFGIVIASDYPDYDTEISIIRERTSLSASDADLMVRVACDVRKALETETVYCTFSTRRLVTWADKARRLGDVKRAASIAVTNRLTPEDAEFINGLVQRYWG